MTKEQVLQNCTVEGNVVKLPSEQLDRKLYQEVAKALELIGGKWKGGKVFGFVFATDPTDLLKEIANGEKRNLKKEFRIGNLINRNYLSKSELDTISGHDLWHSEKLNEPIHSTEWNSIEPVKLQPHILQMFGFKRVFEGGTAYKCNEFWIHDFEEYGIFSGIGHIKLEYAHQLQNLYFAFTGEELVFSITEP